MTPRFDKLLVLDIDETLIHATEKPLPRPPDFCVGRYPIYKRPKVDPFLSACFEWFTVGVWTSSSGDYASEILKHLLPKSGSIAFLMARDRCTPKLDPISGQGQWIKNLKKVERAGYPLEKVIVVDDSPEKHVLNYGNLVRIAEYVGDPSDNELPALLRYLELLGSVENVRAVEKRGWRSSPVVRAN
jgi:RNA polymerase II subunit A small phosphatase-like protein